MLCRDVHADGARSTRSSGSAWSGSWPEVNGTAILWQMGPWSHVCQSSWALIVAEAAQEQGLVARCRGCVRRLSSAHISGEVAAPRRARGQAAAWWNPAERFITDNDSQSASFLETRGSSEIRVVLLCHFDHHMHANATGRPLVSSAGRAGWDCLGLPGWDYPGFACRASLSHDQRMPKMLQFAALSNLAQALGAGLAVARVARTSTTVSDAA
jgi:hypothetical protein